MRPPTKVAKLTSAGGGTAQIQMTCVVVSSLLSTLLRGRQEQRHFALAEKLLTSRLRLVFLSRGGRRVPPPISSVLSCNHDSFIRTPRSSGRLPTKHSVSVFPPQNDSGSPAQRPCTVTRTSSLRATFRYNLVASFRATATLARARCSRAARRWSTEATSLSHQARVAARVAFRNKSWG
jgi:hypothetical protein